MEDLLRMLEESKKYNDVEYFYNKNNNVLEITFDDFEGFDDEWDEVDREYGNAELVEKIEEYLEKNGKLINDCLYKKYQIDNQIVEIGYTSFDI